MNQAWIEKENSNYSRGKSILEGATTIPKGSTAQANGAGSARHLLRGDDDIVCSSRKREAVLDNKNGFGLASQSEHKVRFVFRVDGQPWWSSSLLGRYSTVTTSPFVVTAAR